MKRYACKKCGRELVAVLSRTLWGKHFLCDRCCLVYVVEFKFLMICTNPREHIYRPPAWLQSASPTTVGEMPDTPIGGAR